MKLLSKFAVLVAVAGLAVPTASSALTITSISGTWENIQADPASKPKYAPSGAGTSQIRWGQAATRGGKSGYDFAASPTNLVANPDQSFVLGQFTHRNFPIYTKAGGFLTAVDLAVSFTIAGLANPITSVFSFTHDETNNQARPCAGGRAVRNGGCDDLVTATLNPSSSSAFSIGGISYVLDITGFEVGGQLFQNFWTAEKQTNTAQLLAIFREVGTPNEPPENPNPPAVPLPASGLLLFGAIAGLVARRRFA